jgi:hypothetical protein
MGQLAAAALASGAFAWSFWAAHTSAIPELQVYDGYLMIAGATITVAMVGLLVWHWPRERSLVAIAAASVIGSLVPLGISAARYNIPLVARLRGSWMLGGADVVGPALVVGFVCLWLAMREYRESDLG